MDQSSLCVYLTILIKQQAHEFEKECIGGVDGGGGVTGRGQEEVEMMQISHLCMEF